MPPRHRRPCARVTSRKSLTPAEPEQAGVAVEGAVDLVQRPAELAVQVAVDRRVEVAGAGAHHQSLERREPHRGVDRAPPRIAAADAPLPRCSTTRLVSSTGRPSSSRGTTRDEGVRRAVEAVAADAGARRARPPARRRCRRARASSGGRRCRRPRPAALGEAAAARPAAPRGWPGCAAARAGRGPRPCRAAGRRPGPARRSRSPPCTTRCPTAARVSRSMSGPWRSKASTVERSASSKSANATLLRVVLTAARCASACRCPRRSAPPTRTPRRPRSRRRAGGTSATTTPR